MSVVPSSTIECRTRMEASKGGCGVGMGVGGSVEWVSVVGSCPPIRIPPPHPHPQPTPPQIPAPGTPTDFLLYIIDHHRVRRALARVTGEITRTAEAMRDQRSEASRVLQRGLDRVAEDQVEARLDYIAELYTYGQPLRAGTQEAMVAGSLSRLVDNLALARDYIAEGTGSNSPLDEVRRLQRQLADYDFDL